MLVAAIAFGVTGALVLAASIAGARHEIHPVEQRVFHAVNGLPEWLYWPLWVPMQLGNLLVGTAAGLVLAAHYRSWTMAAAVLAAMVLKLVVEKEIRARLRTLAEVRQRPGASQEGAILRGDVPKSGPSFVSGHVVLVTAIACAVTGHLPGAVLWIPLAAAFVVMFGRVYVGAHNPLDVTAGLGTGLLVGALLFLLAG